MVELLIEIFFHYLLGCDDSWLYLYDFGLESRAGAVPPAEVKNGNLVEEVKYLNDALYPGIFPNIDYPARKQGEIVAD